MIKFTEFLDKLRQDGWLITFVTPSQVVAYPRCCAGSCWTVTYEYTHVECIFVFGCNDRLMYVTKSPDNLTKAALAAALLKEIYATR